MSRATTREALRRLLAPVLTDAGLDLEDLEVTPAGKRRLVRVIVDRDGGVSLDDVAAASQAVSGVLDGDGEADLGLGGSSYVLEVTSPGVDRPLTQLRHWRRANGRLVTATLVSGVEVSGRIAAVGEDAVSVTTNGATRVLALADVVRGRVQVEFNRREPDEPNASDRTGSRTEA